MDEILRNLKNNELKVVKVSLPTAKVLGDSLLSGGCIPIIEAIINKSNENKILIFYQTAKNVGFSLPDHLFVLLI